MRVEHNRWLLCLVLAACNKPTETTNALSYASPSEPAAPAIVSGVVSASAPGPASSASSASATAVPDAIIAQHVLVEYKGAKRAPKTVTRSKTDARARAQEALSEIRAGSPFEDVVKQYSDDAGSADRLGSLGKFRRGDMAPAFAAAAFALKPGEVSDVVETPFGFHVIKRTQ